MTQFHIKYKHHHQGPFSLEQISKMPLRASMLFAHHDDLHWKSIDSFPEIYLIYKKQHKARLRKHLPWLIGILIICCCLFLFFWLNRKPTNKIQSIKEVQIDEIQYTEPIVSSKKIKLKEKVEEVASTLNLQPIAEKVISALPSGNGSGLNVSSIEAHKLYVRNHISEYIRTNRSSFMFAESSGVQDISVVIENKSEFVFDEITVRVDYLTAERELLCSELRVFENVSPYRIIRKMAPPRANCRSVVFLLISLKSKALNMYFTPDRASSSSPDPFFYKW